MEARRWRGIQNLQNGSTFKMIPKEILDLPEEDFWTALGEWMSNSN